MWKLWHKLFGWDYVLVEAFGDQKRVRILRTPTGREYAHLWSTLTDMLFLDSPKRFYTITHLTRDNRNDN